MKKIICIALTLMMILSLCATANAATTVKEYDSDKFNATTPVTENADVKVKIDADGDGIPDDSESESDVDAPTAVYYVKITWENLDFMYSGGTWDPEALAYVDGSWKTEDANGDWVAQPADGKKVTVENRSNAAIEYDAYFGTTAGTNTATVNNVTATLNFLDSKELASAVGQTTVGTLATIGVKVSGEPNTLDAGFNVGTITVKVTAK